MAGMEGGVGGDPMNWRPFWLTMLSVAVAAIALVTLGEWMGWLH